jgi:hypothetical protein
VRRTAAHSLGTNGTNRLDARVLFSFLARMSTVKPDRIPIAMRRRGCETVELMLRGLTRDRLGARKRDCQRELVRDYPPSELIPACRPARCYIGL